MEHLFLSEMGSAIATKYSRKAKRGGIIILCIVSQPPTHTCTKQKHPVPTEVERNPLGKIALRDIMVHPLVNFSSIVIGLLLIKNVQFQLLEFSCHLKASICSLLHYSLASVA